MNTPAALAGAVSIACALPPGSPASGPIPLWVRSHNRSAVDVYLLCGDRDPQWLGEVSERATGTLEIPASREYCARKLNFFLVVRSSGWGYWVGPFQPARGGQVELVIEKYAGLSSASVSR